MQPNCPPEMLRPIVAEQAPDAEAILKLLDYLSDETLLEEMRSGNATIALVRPELETTTNLPGSDVEIAETIEEHINHLGLITKFSIKLDPQAVSEFYEGAPMQFLMQQPPIRDHKQNNQWDEFSNVMTSGVTTVLILHSPDGDAIKTWRQQVGDRHIEAHLGEPTLRGQFGIDSYSTFIHGSDAPEAAERELEVITRCLERKITG